MIPLDFTQVIVQTIAAPWLQQNNITLDALRLDTIHDVVSGNKWFKLKYYLEEAKASNHHTVATFGGAWSNHIVATAFAAREAGLQSVGIIRGEKPVAISATLKNALDFGMKPIYVSRNQYADKDSIKQGFAEEYWFWINEGGYGITGMKGAAEILSLIDASKYTHIVAAVGTGTMLAGLALSSTKNQEVLGISSMKGNIALEEQVRKLLPNNLQSNFRIIHDYHFGGYGKHPPELIAFINEVYRNHQLPLDIVYTAKTFYAITDLVKKSFFKQGSSLLMIHSGGLQGNKSLPPKVLAF